MLGRTAENSAQPTSTSSLGTDPLRGRVEGLLRAQSGPIDDGAAGPITF
jgi:hypothetical protein